MKILQTLGAICGGLLAAMLVVSLLQWGNSLIYKMPPDTDPNNLQEIANWIKTLPTGALVLALVSEAIGYFVATYIARSLAPNRNSAAALCVWGLLLVATIANLSMIPHPWWFMIASLLSWLLFGMLGMILGAPASYMVQNSQLIDAPLARVFQALASIDQFSKAVPDIKKVEFLTDSHYGVGTRFRETRSMNGKEAATELEVTELVENEHVRIVSDAGGTIWDTVFRVKPVGNSVEAKMQMDARPHTFAAKIVTPMIVGMVSKFVQRDMEAVKEYCETSE